MLFGMDFLNLSSIGQNYHVGKFHRGKQKEEENQQSASECVWKRNTLARFFGPLLMHLSAIAAFTPAQMNDPKGKNKRITVGIWWNKRFSTYGKSW